jgi:carbon storage regulator
MLVLSRRLGEKIVVPQCGLSVTVIGIQGNRVRLGISAPPEVAVYREELSIGIQPDGVNETKLDQESWDALAANLSDAAYQIALRRRPADSWMELAMDLSRALATTIKQWKRRRLSSAPTHEVFAESATAPHLPR